MNASEAVLEVEKEVPAEEENYLDIIHQHHEMMKVVEKHFNSIFPIKRQYSMIQRLDNLRMASSAWDGDVIKTIVVPDRLAMFEKVKELSEKVVGGVYKGRFMCDVEHECYESYKKQLHDLEMILYRHERIYQREQKPISLAMLTPGTVVEFDIGIGRDRKGTRTVMKLSGCDLGFGLIHCVETVMEHGNTYVGCLFPRSVPDMFNSSHVKKVLKHVPGPLLIEKYDNENYNQSFVKYDVQPKEGKSKNTYHFQAGTNFLAAKIIDSIGIMRDTHLSVNFADLYLKFLDSGYGVKLSTRDEDDWVPRMVTVRKKKAKRWIRQNMNRYLMTMKKQWILEKRYQDEMNSHMDDFNEGF